MGDKAPSFSRASNSISRDGRGSDTRSGRGGTRRGREGVLGKRRRDSESEGDSDIPEDIQRIPMPRDTPPPFPKEVLDKWYQARRDRWARDHPSQDSNNNNHSSSANSTPLTQNERSAGFESRRIQQQQGEEGRGGDGEGRKRVDVEAKTVYESAPVVRDLRKEAVAFIPAMVRKKLEKGKGAGGLLEPEEADRLEREGYLRTSSGGGGERGSTAAGKNVQMEEVDDEEG